MDLERLGPYDVKGILGRGGMGTVYEGVNVETGESAAIKVLTPLLAANEGFRERFESEIETLRQLRHPHIVRLYGFGERDGHLFYAMELVAGPSLEEELQSGRRFDWKEVAQLAVQICHALKHAHDRGVIHRDIKPANLLLAPDDTVRLSDFGIAKLFGMTGMTVEGGVLGTAEYMAPEQADGRPVTHRCDLYSLGAVMYTLLAGRAPFRAQTLPEMLQLQRFAEPEPLRRFAPKIPQEMELIVAELLTKDPGDRIANATLLARRLESMQHGLAHQESSPEESASKPPVDGSTLDGDSIPAAADDDGDVDLWAKTQASTGSHQQTPGETADIPLAEPAPVTEFASRPNTVPATEGGSEDAKRSGASRFTTVKDEDRRPDGHWADLLAGLSSPQTWLLLAALLGVLALGWYYLQPPTANELYAEIVAAAPGGQAAQFARVEDEIDSFLERFPSEGRAEEIRKFKRAVTNYRVQRRMDRGGQAARAPDPATPAQWAYREAMRYADNDPEKAIAKLQALVKLFAAADSHADDARPYVAMARTQSKRLRGRIERNAAEHIRRLEPQLAAANRLRDTDPQAAREIWQAIVELYGEKPWAAPLVERARTSLLGLAAGPADSNPANEHPPLASPSP